MSSFQDLGVFRSNNSEAEAQRSYAHALSLSCNSTRHTRNSFRLLPLGNCERKTSNLEKMIIVLSVFLLIYVVRKHALEQKCTRTLIIYDSALLGILNKIFFMDFHSINQRTCHKLRFFYPFIFAVNCNILQIFQFMNSGKSKNLHLKCPRSLLNHQVEKDLGINKSQFVAKTQFLSFYLSICLSVYLSYIYLYICLSVYLSFVQSAVFHTSFSLSF